MTSTNYKENDMDPPLNTNQNPDLHSHALLQTLASEDAVFLSDSTSLLLQLSPDADQNRNHRSITRRIEREYGIQRRLLKRYGMDIQVLEETGIGSQDLENHATISRLLKRYGLSPQVITEHGDQLTDSLLAVHSISRELLQTQGVSSESIDQFNVFNSTLNRHGTSVEQFLRDQKSSPPEVNVVGYSNRKTNQIRVSLELNILGEVVGEMIHDPGITDIYRTNF